MKKAFLLLILAVLALGFTTPAQALSPCGRKLVNDWYDGRIDKRYPVRCYRDAIRFANRTEVRVYTSLAEDLRRALLASLRGKKNGNNKKTVKAGFIGRKGGPRDPRARGDDDGRGNGNEADFATAREVTEDEGGSLPIPLIILGVLGGLLVAAGGASYARRWLATRQVQGPDSAA